MTDRTEQYKPNIGEEPEENARRDAIHIAVAPVVVGEEDVLPGTPVGLINDQIYPNHPQPIGIVDPFLPYITLKRGQRCWLFLFPNTITNLRHVWEHPAFKARPYQSMNPLPKES